MAIVKCENQNWVNVVRPWAIDCYLYHNRILPKGFSPYKKIKWKIRWLWEDLRARFGWDEEDYDEDFYG